MDAIQLLRNGFSYVHEEPREDISGVEPASLFWQPAAGANHIGFLFWHIVRDEDTVVGYVRNRPQVWNADRWHKRLDMDPSEQGTGLDPGRLAAFRYDLAPFLDYAEAVWVRTDEDLAAMSPDDLQQPAWQWTAERLLNEGCLGHCWVHLGEIRAIKGLRGWRFRE